MLNGYSPVFTNAPESLYEMELTRAAIHSFANFCSKLKPEISGTAYKNLERVLQFRPNPFMDTSKFIYRIATILSVNNTAFIVPIEDEYGGIAGYYPLLPQRCEVVEYKGAPFLRYTFANGQRAAIEFERVGVMTQFQYSDDFFGESNAALRPTMQLIHTQNQGIINGVKNSASVRFLAKVANMLKPEDITKERKRFTADNLSADNQSGMVIYDSKFADVKPIESKPFTVNDMGIAGAITVLLKDALLPNLVQTTENTPAFIHGGPFANIAHGCNSVLATQMALTYGDYVITEAGFGADLGAEKFFNIKCRKAGLSPKLTVIVATAQSLKLHGGVPEAQIKEPNKEGLIRGFANLDKHIENMKNFGQQVIVTFNRFASDTDEEIALVAEHCKEKGVGFAVNTVFADGGKGAVELARLVAETIEKNTSKPLKFTYEESDSIRKKVRKIAEGIYGASSIVYTTLAEKKLKEIEKLGIAHFPVCIAKTQYSFSSDPKAYGVAKDFELKVRDIIINNGAEMIVVVMGEIMRMPGLPKEPQARHIDIVNGLIEGLS